MIMFSSSGLTVFLYRLPGPEDEGCRLTAAGHTSMTIDILARNPTTQFTARHMSCLVLFAA